MYALKISINGREPVTGGANDLCVLSDILSLTFAKRRLFEMRGKYEPTGPTDG